MTEWFAETLHKDVAQSLRMDRVLFRERTGLQELVIFENARFGRVLALDGAVQTTEGDEFVYHEMMAHVPILAHGAVKRVLIVGGGDGGLLRRCLLHPGVETVTMVEIDRGVIDLCVKYLPGLSAGAFDDARAEVVIADGARFVAETDRRFDVILVDSTDPQGPGEVLFTAAFYADCKRCLTPGGILVTQNGVPFLQPDEVRHSAEHLGQSFAVVTFYMAVVPTYFGGIMTLGWATDEAQYSRLTATDLSPRFAAAGLQTRYYTPELHVGAFALPAFIKALCQGA